MTQSRSRLFNYLNRKALGAVFLAKRVSFPGFEGIPIYDVILFFLKGLQKGALTTRASSIAFHIFLALLPTIIYFFTLIPHLPVENFEEGLLSMLQDILPLNAFELIENTLRDMFIPRTGLSVLGFLIALIFATNAVNGMIVAFNATYHSIETRSWLERRAIAALLVFILFILITTAVSLIVFSRAVVSRLVELDHCIDLFGHFSPLFPGALTQNEMAVFLNRLILCLHTGDPDIPDLHIYDQ